MQHLPGPGRGTGLERGQRACAGREACWFLVQAMDSLDVLRAKLTELEGTGDCGRAALNRLNERVVHDLASVATALTVALRAEDPGAVPEPRPYWPG